MLLEIQTPYTATCSARTDDELTHEEEAVNLGLCLGKVVQYPCDIGKRSGNDQGQRRICFEQGLCQQFLSCVHGIKAASTGMISDSRNEAVSRRCKIGGVDQRYPSESQHEICKGLPIRLTRQWRSLRSVVKLVASRRREVEKSARKAETLDTACELPSGSASRSTTISSR